MVDWGYSGQASSSYRSPWIKWNLVISVLSPLAFSQELTSDISGVVSSGGDAVGGATVEITHVPTNSSVTRVTADNGRYRAAGLRPGGPYKVKVSATGLLSDTAETYLQVGETGRVSFTLTAVGDVDDVVVVGQKIEQIAASGYTTTIDAETIQNTPSITRDIKDLMRLNPLVSLDDAEERYEDQYDSHGVLIKDQVVSKREGSDIFQNFS